MDPEARFIFFLLVSCLLPTTVIEFSLSFLLQGARGIVAYFIFTTILMRLIYLTIPRNIKEIIALLKIKLNRVMYITGVMSGLAILVSESIKQFLHPVLTVLFVATGLVYCLALPLISVRFFNS